MRLSIVGSSGFIGGALAALLRTRGHDLYLPDRDALRHGPPEGGWGMMIWAAGLTANYRSRPFDTVHAHVSALSELLTQHKPAGLLYLSSTRIYQHATRTDEGAQIPCEPFDPSDLYNISKLMGESLCLSSGVENVKVARLSNIVGPGEGERSTFIGALCREARSGEIRLQTDPASSKDYLWIDDAARYLADLATGPSTGILNVARGAQIRHSDWVERLSDISGADSLMLPDAPNGGFPPIDVSRLTGELGAGSCDPLDRVEEIYRQN